MSGVSRGRRSMSKTASDGDDAGPSEDLSLEARVCRLDSDGDFFLFWRDTWLSMRNFALPVLRVRDFDCKVLLTNNRGAIVTLSLTYRGKCFPSREPITRYQIF